MDISGSWNTFFMFIAKMYVTLCICFLNNFECILYMFLIYNTFIFPINKIIGPKTLYWNEDLSFMYLTLYWKPTSHFCVAVPEFLCRFPWYIDLPTPLSMSQSWLLSTMLQQKVCRWIPLHLSSFSRLESLPY